MTKNLAIIIPVYNQLHYTRQVIQSIIKERKNTKNIETIHLVIVDNASTDETSEFLKGEEYLQNVDGLKFYYIISETNLGYGGGSNKGIKLIKETYCVEDCDYLIMNNDMVVLEGCFDKLEEAAYSDSKIGIVGGKLLFPDSTIQHAGAFLNVFGWGQHKGGGLREVDYLVEERVEEQEYVTGALFYLKETSVEILLEKDSTIFDEQFFMYFEEVDMCYRLRKYGYITVYTPFARAIHFENVSN